MFIFIIMCLHIFLVESSFGDDIGSVCEEIDVISLFFLEKKGTHNSSRARALSKFVLWLICSSGRNYDWRLSIVGVSSAPRGQVTQG